VQQPVKDSRRQIGALATGGAVFLVLLAAIGWRWNVPLHVLWPVPILALVAAAVLGQPLVRRLHSVADASSDVLSAWGTTRLLVLMAGMLAVLFIGIEPGHGRFRVSDNVLANLPARWDAGWYLNIARYGYTWEPGGLAQQQRVAFFPAFPLAMRYVADVLTLVARLLNAPDWLGGGNGRYVWAGTLISLSASLIGSLYVAATARRHVGPDAARRAVWLLMAYPFAVFFNAPYTEGLFLLAASGALYHLQFGRPHAASAFGLLAGLTRPNGFLVSGAMLVSLLCRWRQSETVTPSQWLSAAMPLVGVTAYSTFVYTLAGDPLAWLKAQAAWGNTYTVTGFWLAKWEHAASAGWQFVLAPFGLWSLLAVCLVAVTVAPVARLLGLGYATYLVVYLLPPLLINLPAIGRMTCVLFPTFIWLGTWAHTRPRFVVALVVFLAAQLLCAVQFFTWGGIM
jgi:hypothetical protein